MKLPFIVGETLSQDSLANWNNFYLPTKGKKEDRTCEESLWRRTQSEANKSMSGWQSDFDKRRKILYYKHEYDVKEINPNDHRLCLVATFIYVSLTLPKDELAEYLKIFGEKLSSDWLLAEGVEGKVFKFGELTLKIRHYANPSENKHEYTSFPQGYETLEIELKSDQFVVPDNLCQIIWGVTKSRLRKKKTRGKPTYTKDIRDILKFAPFQVEIGCGPAFEAGVFPLHVLHDLYSINEPFTKKFIMSAKEDNFVTLMGENPQSLFLNISRFFYSIVSSKTSSFYKLLREFYDRGIIVGPVITNNFDGICLRVGLKEHFIRTYTETELFPDINFDSRARSLLVIGCHADRRNVEELAHSKGLPVNYIDPEGWWVEGEFFEYPLESPQDDSLIYKAEASSAFTEIAEVMRIETRE